MTTGRRVALAVLLPASALLMALAVALRAQEPVEAPAPSPPVATAVIAVAADGPTLFHEKGCEYCHGATAAGTEKGPSLLRVKRQLKKAAIMRQIHDGGGGMPAFGEALSSEEIENLVAYLETLKPLPRTSGKKVQP